MLKIEAAGTGPPFGQFFEIGGRRIWLHQSGSGGPAVIFLPGGGTVGLDYWNVQARAADFTTSVIYDRGGTGWSDHLDLPRTSTEVTDELRDVLRVARVAAPYVLVGHSLGGLYARHYGLRFPEEVAGLVLLDPAHEDYNAYMPRELVEMWNAWDPDQALPDELPAELIQLYRSMLAAEMGEWPAVMRELLVDCHVSPGWFRVGLQEARNVEQLYDEVRQVGSMPDVPLIILTSMDIDDFKQAVSGGTPETLLRAEIEGKRRLHDALAASVARGENRLVDGAGHVTLHFRRPSAVIEAIRDIVRT